MKLNLLEHLHLGSVLHLLVARFGNDGTQQVYNAIEQAHNAGVSIWSIVTTILSMLATITGGGTLNIQDIIDAILKLIAGK